MFRLWNWNSYFKINYILPPFSKTTCVNKDIRNKLLIVLKRTKMKKILLISAFLVSTSIMFGQFTINYSGGITNHPTTPIMVYLEVDSVIVDSVLTTPASAGYIGSVNVNAQPWILRVLFYDCNGIEIYNTHFPASTISSPYSVSYPTLNYCSTSGCNAVFSKFQAIDPITLIPIPNQVVLADASTGTALTYSWDFGDGSAPLTGLNVTHTYGTHGSYNICLTVVGTTTGGTCTSTFCDTLTVDSTGSVRSSFTVSTGNSALSIEENSTINSLKLFPNPANEFAIIEFESAINTNLSIKVIDMKGAEIQVENQSVFSGNNRIQLNTSNLDEGVYVVQLQDGTSIVTKRMQIVK